MRKTWFAAALVAVAVVVIAGTALLGRTTNTAAAAGGASPRIFVAISGQKQGAISGDVPASPAFSPSIANQIEVYGLTHSVVMPVDPQSGLPTGQRQHKPITLRLAWSKASIPLYEALTDNENLRHVTITFYEPYARGAATLYRQYAKIVLTNAVIVSMSEEVPPAGARIEANPADPAADHFQHQEVLTLVYQQIEWSSIVGGKVISAMDDWERPTASPNK